MKLPDPFTPNLSVESLGQFEKYQFGGMPLDELITDEVLRSQLDAIIPTTGESVPDDKLTEFLNVLCDSLRATGESAGMVS